MFAYTSLDNYSLLSSFCQPRILFDVVLSLASVFTALSIPFLIARMSYETLTQAFIAVGLYFFCIVNVCLQR